MGRNDVFISDCQLCLWEKKEVLGSEWLDKET